MAHRRIDHSDLSKFGNRLWDLMACKDLDTAHKLANALYDGNYITVKQRKKHESLFDKKKSAVDSIEHKINKHINSETPSILQADYAKAYCDFFQCSYDYLFGQSTIKYIDLDIRKNCEYLDLSEESVKSLRFRGDVFNKYKPENERNLLDELLSNKDFKDFISTLYDIDLINVKYLKDKEEIENSINNRIGERIKSISPEITEYTEEDLESFDLSDKEIEELKLLSKYIEDIRNLDLKHDYDIKVYKYELSEICMAFINTLLTYKAIK